jgi:hypothetical protein
MTTPEEQPPSGAMVIVASGECEVIKGGEEPSEGNDTDEGGDR